MRPRNKVLVALAAPACVTAALFACADDPHRRTTADQVNVGGGACEAKAGALPAPDCDNSDKSCAPTPGCTIDEAACGSKSTCLPLADNKGKDVLDFRIRRLNVAAPEALAASFIQTTVVTANIDFNEPRCGELGKGLFTWLMRVDRKNGQLITGGAPPLPGAISSGFCFARFDSNGIPIDPITLKIEESGGKLRTTEKKKVNIPIFLSEALSSAIVLPITDVTVEGVSISDDGNCIGSLNPAALASNCSDDPSACSKWNTSGALGGFITLEEADEVFVKDLNRSLCVVLSRDQADPEGKCPREGGKIKFKGDYCSTDRQAGSCQDAVWMAATFAASAVKVIDGADTEGCRPRATTDAGADAGADAGDTDAGDAATD
ncbi:MAG: hypothetical protein KC657_06105 [Myxococcales bacterium]|nr:hypothetical protein [Myxococcales bacterium]